MKRSLKLNNLNFNRKTTVFISLMQPIGKLSCVLSSRCLDPLVSFRVA
jgi:hypothetical protein